MQFAALIPLVVMVCGDIYCNHARQLIRNAKIIDEEDSSNFGLLFALNGVGVDFWDIYVKIRQNP